MKCWWRNVEVDSPCGYTLPDWRDCTERYHGPGCAVTPIAELPEPPGSPVNLDEALAAACKGVAGITAVEFRLLLSPEEIADIEGGHYPVETLRAYTLSFAEGIRSGRITRT